MKTEKVNSLQIKPLNNESGFKILDIRADEGGVLRKHKTDRPAVLLVIEGSLVYKESDKIVELSAGDVHDIPPSVFHELAFNTPSKVLVIMSSESNIEFKK